MISIAILFLRAFLATFLRSCWVSRSGLAIMATNLWRWFLLHLCFKANDAMSRAIVKLSSPQILILFIEALIGAWSLMGVTRIFLG